MRIRLVPHVGRRAAAVLLLASGCSGGPAPDPGQLPADYTAQVQAWRTTHEADYRRDFVTIAGLHFLEAGTHTIGSGADNDLVIEAAVPARIGRLRVGEDDVTFEPDAGISPTRKGQPVAPPVVLKPKGDRAAEPVGIGDVTLAVHVTGGRLALRVRDPAGAPARAFAGFAWFAIDPSYRVVGRFVRDEAPKRVPVMNTFNGVDTYETEGIVEFTLGGQPLRLRPFTTRPGRLYIVFRDASSGAETYEAARFLYADVLEDGRVVLDFNQAYNPPCAFNHYTTCPIPLKENVLPVKVLAGEKAYAGKS